VKIGIICVALNCLEYSKQTLDSIQTSHPYEIIFIDNGSTDGTKEWLNTRPDIISIKNPIVSGLAACWNLGIKRAINDDCDLFFVINNDMVLAKNTIDNLVKKIKTEKYVMVTGVNDQSITPDKMKDIEKEYDENEPDNEHPDFSCFMINKDCIEKIGLFDENMLVAYFEDSDFHARIALANEKAVSTVSGTYYHLCSQTIKNNPHLKKIIEEAFKHNREYFISKYGCEPLGDVPNMREKYFKIPFNGNKKQQSNLRTLGNLW
jgi:GT2 family glycosyltransferase